jgi:uncharacterized protein (DUF2336 family)
MSTDQLLQIARDKSVQGRENLANAVSNLFLEQGTELSDREKTLTLDILHRLVHDFERTVRKIVSEKLCDWPNMPDDLAHFLASDEIDIAYPILTKSGVLQDENLIEIIRHRTMEHQMAIAIRQNVSESVSDALVQGGHDQVILTLLENKSAQISGKTMQYLVDQAKRVDTFREPILRRDELDDKLAQQMYLWVSAAMRKYISEKFEMDEGAIDDLLEQSAVQLFAQASTTRLKSSAEDLVDELEANGKIDPELILDVLRAGEVNLFIAMFKKVTNLREQLLRRILFEPGGEGLAIACKGVGVEKNEFSTIFALSRRANPNSVKDFSNEIRNILKFYEELDIKDAKSVLKRWQRDNNYLKAIRELEIRIS